ncbi:hypothetical protein CHISP_1079 [Chitinispirillum alkaliphilum]|nr:hypothetical protein CHISP_1079 [Chitinispirillum alkaliphilum]
MVLYKIDEVETGMILGEGVYDENGRLLLSEGFEIKPAHINMLRQRGYKQVLIAVKGTEGVRPERVVTDQVKNELASTVCDSERKLKQIFKPERYSKERIIDIVKKDKPVINQILRKKDLLTVVGKCIEDIINEPWTAVNLAKMEGENKSVFDHSLNVLILSLCIGHRYRLDKEELFQLGLGAINYDIGMLTVPEKIIHKDGPLNEEEQKVLQQHTLYGYTMLSDNSAIPPTSAMVALSHHENQDGSGFPRGIKGENRPPVKTLKNGGLIHRFAEIVAVADAFEMFCFGRKHYSEGLGVEGAIKKLLSLRGDILNSDIVNKIIAITPVYPQGVRIRVTGAPLENLIGSTGVVSKTNPGDLAHPQVIIYENAKGVHIKPIPIDLRKYKTIKVEVI